VNYTFLNSTLPVIGALEGPDTTEDTESMTLNTSCAAFLPPTASGAYTYESPTAKKLNIAANKATSVSLNEKDESHSL